MKIKNFISAVTATCFLFSFVFAPAVEAGIELKRDTKEFKQLLNEFVIPPAAGRITRGRYFDSNTIVINVQDLHCHPEVQRNISRILSLLGRECKLSNVFVEGAYGDVDTSWLCDIKDKELRKEIVETLVERGELTGAEHYSITSNMPGLLKGVEDRDLHKGNLIRLGKMLEKAGYYENKLSQFDKDLEFMKARHYGLRNKRLNKIIAQYKKGQINADKYFVLLGKYAARINSDPDKFNALFSIRMNNYPNISGYMHLMDMGQRLKYGRVASQLQEFVRILKAKLPYNAYNFLLQRTDNFSKLDELYVYLAKISREYDLKLSYNFPDLQEFFDYTEKSRNINPLDLVREEKRLVEEIRIGLSQDVGELEVSFLEDFLGYFRDYLLNKLSAEDYEYFVQRFDEFKSVWGKYTTGNTLLDMTEDFALLDAYYKVNCERNNSFLKHMLSAQGGEPTVAPMQPSDDRDAYVPAPPGSLDDSIAEIMKSLGKADQVMVVVTGGFHTEGIQKLFEERKISYLAITPNVTQDTRRSDIVYTEFARQQAKVLSNSLALGLASQFSVPAMFELAVRAANKELQGVNFTESNVRKLVEKLQDAMKVEVKLEFRQGGSKAVITFPNGSKITLNKKGDGMQTGKELSAPPARAAAGVSLETIHRILTGMLDATVDNMQFINLIPGTYAALKNLMIFAVNHNMVDGSGLIFELAKDPALGEKIDGIDRDMVGRFPEGMQEIIREHLQREKTLDAAAQQNNALKIFFANHILRDLIVSLTNGAKVDTPTATLGSSRLVQGFLQFIGLWKLLPQGIRAGVQKLDEQVMAPVLELQQFSKLLALYLGNRAEYEEEVAGFYKQHGYKVSDGKMFNAFASGMAGIMADASSPLLRVFGFDIPKLRALALLAGHARYNRTARKTGKPVLTLGTNINIDEIEFRYKYGLIENPEQSPFSNLYAGIYPIFEKLCKSTGLSGVQLYLFDYDGVGAFTHHEHKVIAMSTGLFRFLSEHGQLTEDVVAAIIAHEIAHNFQEHGRGFIYRFGAEIEADLKAIEILNKLGYNVNALPDFFALLTTITKSGAKWDQLLNHMLDEHMGNETRTEYLREVINKKLWINSGKNTYLKLSPEDLQGETEYKRLVSGPGSIDNIKKAIQGYEYPDFIIIVQLMDMFNSTIMWMSSRSDIKEEISKILAQITYDETKKELISLVVLSLVSGEELASEVIVQLLKNDKAAVILDALDLVPYQYHSMWREISSKYQHVIKAYFDYVSQAVDLKNYDKSDWKTLLAYMERKEYGNTRNFTRFGDAILESEILDNEDKVSLFSEHYWLVRFSGNINNNVLNFLLDLYESSSEYDRQIERLIDMAVSSKEAKMKIARRNNPKYDKFGLATSASLALTGNDAESFAQLILVKKEDLIRYIIEVTGSIYDGVIAQRASMDIDIKALALIIIMIKDRITSDTSFVESVIDGLDSKNLEFVALFIKKYREGGGYSRDRRIVNQVHDSLLLNICVKIFLRIAGCPQGKQISNFYAKDIQVAEIIACYKNNPVMAEKLLSEVLNLTSLPAYIGRVDSAANIINYFKNELDFIITNNTISFDNYLHMADVYLEKGPFKNYILFAIFLKEAVNKYGDARIATMDDVRRVIENDEEISLKFQQVLMRLAPDDNLKGINVFLQTYILKRVFFPKEGQAGKEGIGQGRHNFNLKFARDLLMSLKRNDFRANDSGNFLMNMLGRMRDILKHALLLVQKVFARVFAMENVLGIVSVKAVSAVLYRYSTKGFYSHARRLLKDRYREGISGANKENIKVIVDNMLNELLLKIIYGRPLLRRMMLKYMQLLARSRKIRKIDLLFFDFNHQHKFAQMNAVLSDFMEKNLRSKIDSNESFHEVLGHICTVFPDAQPARDEFINELVARHLSLHKGNKSKLINILTEAANKTRNLYLKNGYLVHALEIERALLEEKHIADWNDLNLKELNLSEELLREYEKAIVTVSIQRELQLIVKYFPEKSYFRDDLLRSLLERVEQRDEYHLIKDMLYSEKKNILQDGQLMEHSFYEEKIKILFEELPADRKKDFVLWLLGIKEKPLFIKEYEVLLGVSFDRLKEIYGIKNDSKYYKHLGESSRAVLIAEMFAGSDGILADQNAYDDFLREFIGHLFKKSKMTRKLPRKTLEKIFYVIMNESERSMQLEIIKQLAINFADAMDENKGGKYQLDEMIKKFFISLDIVGIKVAQILASSSDIELPENLRKTLMELTSNARAETKEVVFESLLNLRRENIFVKIGRQIGRGSIKIVFSAVTRDGRTVALKLKSPTVVNKLFDQLNVFKRVCASLRNQGVAIPYGFEDRASEGIGEDADFENEIRNARILEKQLKEINNENKYHLADGREVAFVVPEIYEGSDELIILSEQVDGVELNNLANTTMLTSAQVQELNEIIFDFLMTQLFRKGMFLADPHPGNFMVKIAKDGSLRVYLIDVGALESIERNKEVFLGLLESMAFAKYGLKTTDEYIWHTLFFSKTGQLGVEFDTALEIMFSKMGENKPFATIKEFKTYMRRIIIRATLQQVVVARISKLVPSFAKHGMGKQKDESEEISEEHGAVVPENISDDNKPGMESRLVSETSARGFATLESSRVFEKLLHLIGIWSLLPRGARAGVQKFDEQVMAPILELQQFSKLLALYLGNRAEYEEEVAGFYKRHGYKVSDEKMFNAFANGMAGIMAGASSPLLRVLGFDIPKLRALALLVGHARYNRKARKTGKPVLTLPPTQAGSGNISEGDYVTHSKLPKAGAGRVVRITKSEIIIDFSGEERKFLPSMISALNKITKEEADQRAEKVKPDVGQSLRFKRELERRSGQLAVSQLIKLIGDDEFDRQVGKLVAKYGSIQEVWKHYYKTDLYYYIWALQNSALSDMKFNFLLSLSNLPGYKELCDEFFDAVHAGFEGAPEQEREFEKVLEKLMKLGELGALIGEYDDIVKTGLYVMQYAGVPAYHNHEMLDVVKTIVNKDQRELDRRIGFLKTIDVSSFQRVPPSDMKAELLSWLMESSEEKIRKYKSLFAELGFDAILQLIPNYSLDYALPRLLAIEPAIRHAGIKAVVALKEKYEDVFVLLFDLQETFAMDIIEKWADIQYQLLRFYNATTAYNRERISELLFDAHYLAVLKNRKADVLKHFGFYNDVIRENRRLAYAVLEGVTEGVEREKISATLEKEEQKSILDFISETNSFNPIIYDLYRKNGKGVLQPLREFAAKVFLDEIGEEQIREFLSSPFFMNLNEDENLNKENKIEILSAAVQMAIPASGASFVGKKEVADLLRKIVKAGDERDHVPEPLRNRDFGGNAPIPISKWEVKKGEEVDPEGKIMRLIAGLRNKTMREGAKEKAILEDRGKLIEALKAYFADYGNTVKRESCLEAFYRYASHNDLLQQKIDAVQELDYLSLLFLEQLFIDKDNLASLLREVLKDMPKEKYPKKQVEAGKADYGTLITLIGNHWNNARKSEEERKKGIQGSLRKYGRDYNINKTTILSDSKIKDGALKEYLASLEFAEEVARSEHEIIETLFAAPIEMVRKEKDAKFEENRTAKKIDLGFRVVKGIPHGLWGLNAGVCIATDIELWKDKNFFLLEMYDKESDKVVGYVHLYEAIVEGERVLTVPGIEPSTEILSEVRAGALYPLIESALLKIKEKGGYVHLYIPTLANNGNITSNRKDILQIISKRYGKVVGLKQAISWNREPAPYPFTEVWEIERPANTKESPNAILPGNLPRVNQWANEGKSAFGIAVRVALREFVPSFFAPGEFVAAHTDQRGAKLVVYSGIAFGIAVGIATIASLGFAAPVLTIVAGIISGLFAGASANTATHVFLDWHYVKSSGLIEAINEFGAAALDNNGSVHTNIYLMENLPENPGQWGLRNTGLNINGKPVWASTKAGALVLFADGVDLNTLSQNINGSIAGKGKLSGSGRLIERLKGLFKAAGVDLAGRGFRPGMTIDHTSTGEILSYNADGTMVVTRDWFDNSSAPEKDIISAKLGELMTIRDAEAVAMPQSIVINLDDVRNFEEFKQNLEAFNKAGNGQMIVNPAVFKGLSTDAVNKITELARNNGVAIYVDLQRDAAENGRYREMGFAGYVATVNGKTALHSFILSGEGVKAELIRGFRSADELKNRISRSPAGSKIINLSELRELLKGGERSIVDRVALTEILKTTVLSLYSARSLTKEYVENVAYAWNREQLPPAPPETIPALFAAIQTNDPAQIVKAMGIGNVSHPVTAYLAKLRNDVGGRDQQKLQDFQTAFLSAIAEKMLAKAKLDEAGKTNGLADAILEKILGQKLLQQMKDKTEGKGRLITAEKFEKLYEGRPAIDLYAGLHAKVVSELCRDDNQSKPEAINAIIDLIPQLGEPRIIHGKEKLSIPFTPQAIDAVLGAA